MIGGSQYFQILEQGRDLILCMLGKICDCKYETKWDIGVPVSPERRLHLS